MSVTEKQLKIKLGVVKRLKKDIFSYEKEVADNEKRVEKEKADGADEGRIKQWIAAGQESKDMITDCTKRLGPAIDALKKAMEDADDEAKASESFSEAKALAE